MASKNYFIYIHKNKINGKIYVGQTCQKPEYRWNNGEGYKRQPYFYSAIQKYGWNNFEHIILKQDLSLEEANYWEEYYIKQYDTTNHNFGYNLTLGGNNKIMLEETKQKISEANKGKIVSEETKQKISQANKGKISLRKGQCLSERHRQNISISKKGKSFSDEHILHLKEAHKTEYQKKINQEKFGIKIQCIETGDIFNSFQEAANWAGLSSGCGISDFFRGKQKSAGKHPITKKKLHWKKI